MRYYKKVELDDDEIEEVLFRCEAASRLVVGIIKNLNLIYERWPMNALAAIGQGLEAINKHLTKIALWLSGLQITFSYAEEVAECED